MYSSDPSKVTFIRWKRHGVLIHFLSAELQRSPDLTYPIVEMGKLRLKVAQNLLSPSPESPPSSVSMGTPEGGNGDRRGPGSWGPSPDVPPHQGTPLSYLQREPFISNDGCLGPVDDFGERQLPARAKEHRDTAGLGGRAVIGEPSPSLHRLTTTPIHSSSPCC